MPRFFFNTRYNHYSPDTEGVELPDLRSAWSQASQMAGQILQDLDGELVVGREWRLEVCDADARMLFALRFSAEFYDA